MKKTYIYLLFVLLFVAGIGIYLYYTSHHMGGESKNGVWEIKFKKTTSVSETDGWNGTLIQTNKDHYEVEKLIFKKKDRVLFELDDFKDETDIDGKKTVLHPFKTEFFTDFIKKGEEYNVEVLYKKGNEKKSTSVSFE